MEEIQKLNDAVLANVGESGRLALVIVAGLILAILVLQLVFGTRKNSSLYPPVMGSMFPILNFWYFSRAPVAWIVNEMKKVKGKYGYQCFTVPIFGDRLTFLIGPDAHSVFFKASDVQVSQNEVYSFMVPVFGPNVVYDAPVNVRERQMRAAASGLKSKCLASYVSKIEMECKLYFSKHWSQKQGQANLKEDLSRLIILTASRCLMGDEIRENLFEDVARLYHDLDMGLTPLSIFFPNAPIPAHFTRNRARQDMIKLFTPLIRARRELKSEDAPQDLLQILCEQTYKDGSLMTESEITGMLIAVLFAGQHTSSITSTWTILYLLRNPQICARVVAEIDANVPKNSIPDKETLDHLTLLHSCIKEAIRLHPPLIYLMRLAKEDLHFHDLIIPAGDKIFVSLAIAGRLESVFKEPTKFDPDRWLPPRNEGTAPYETISFGSGLHTCLGEHFGVIQVKTIVINLFRNYNMSLANPNDFPKEDYTAMVVGPEEHKCIINYQQK